MKGDKSITQSCLGFFSPQKTTAEAQASGGGGRKGEGKGERGRGREEGKVDAGWKLENGEWRKNRMQNQRTRAREKERTSLRVGESMRREEGKRERRELREVKGSSIELNSNAAAAAAAS